MDLFTLGAIAQKINRDLQDGNESPTIWEGMSDEMIDDAMNEIFSAAETLISATRHIYETRMKEATEELEKAKGSEAKKAA